MYIFIAV